MNPLATRRAYYWTFALTILSTMPYENGSIAQIVPVHWKPYIASIGLLAGMILAEIKARQTASNESVDKKQNKLP